ncbi:MAG: peptidoglycan-binding protein [Fimbriimonadaceae bacterium]|nr:peptidoglycan-binding protein [Alphaproteobacteria bacterium]
MTKYLNARSLRRLEGVHPDLVRVVNRAAELSAVPFQITEGLRGLARQKQLVARGASRTLRSRHLTGHAVDVVAYVGPAISWSFPLYLKISESFKAAARELGIAIQWGGDWKTFRDGPHFQLPWRAYPVRGAVQPKGVHQAVLRAGAAGARVIALQERLKATGAQIRVDGDFGPRTHRAVMRFQAAHRLEPDGIAGQETLAALKAAAPV